jgi:hypothetical protein
MWSADLVQQRPCCLRGFLRRLDGLGHVFDVTPIAGTKPPLETRVVRRSNASS